MYGNRSKFNVSCSYYFYRQIVDEMNIDEMNISFAKLGQEECFSCEKYEILRKQSSHVLDADDLACAQCDSYKTQKQKYARAREMYKLGSTASNSQVYTVDLQKVRSLLFAYFVIYKSEFIL